MYNRYKIRFKKMKPWITNTKRSPSKTEKFWYSLPFPAGRWTGATEVRKVVHTHSLSQPGPLWSLISPIRADLFWTLFRKNLARTSSPPPPRLHQRNAKTCENRQNWLQHPESGHFLLDMKIQEGPLFICIKNISLFFYLLKGCDVFCRITINNTM